MTSTRKSIILVTEQVRFCCTHGRPREINNTPDLSFYIFLRQLHPELKLNTKLKVTPILKRQRVRYYHKVKQKVILDDLHTSVRPCVSTAVHKIYFIMSSK